MAEVTQYTFSWPEVTDLLIKKQNLHHGEWLALVEFGISAGMMGQAPPDAKPGIMIIANSVQLAKAQTGAPRSLVRDAAIVNPPPSSSK